MFSTCEKGIKSTFQNMSNDALQMHYKCNTDVNTMVMPLKALFDAFDFKAYGLDASPSWCNNFFTCPYKFKCGKLLNLKPVSMYRPYLFNGRLFHKIAELFFNYCKYERINYYKERETKKYMREICYSFIPSHIRSYADVMQPYIDNFVDYEFERLELIYDLLGQTREAFDRYYMPMFRERRQSWELEQRGIRFVIDVGYRIAPHQFNNTGDEIALGDYKTGKSYDEFLDENLNRQLLFPIPFLDLGKMPRYVIGVHVSSMIPVKFHVGDNKFMAKRREISAHQLLTLKMELDKIEHAIIHDQFNKTYKFCNYCEYVVHCSIDDDILKRVAMYRKHFNYENQQNKIHADDASFKSRF